MAARRGKSQARRNQGNGAGLPGWAWLVLGIALTLAAVLLAPRLLKSGDGDGFLRPHPNPDAQPASTASDDGDDASDDASPPGPERHADTSAASDAPKPTQYDFYTLLPGEEVAMSDAEVAATAREEAVRRNATPAPADAVTPAATPASTATATAAAATTATTPAAPKPASTAVATGNDTPYILQAGAFAASGDAEAVKARIALLGLGARVESAQINGKTVYRVRMGPYGSASELAEAKGKLANGGLPALAIKAK